MTKGLERLPGREPERARMSQFGEDTVVGTHGQDFKKEAEINTTVIYQIPQYGNWEHLRKWEGGNFKRDQTEQFLTL